MGIVKRFNELDDNGGFAGAAHFFHIRHHAEFDEFIAGVLSGRDYNIIAHSRAYMEGMAGKKSQIMRAAISSETFIWE